MKVKIFSSFYHSDVEKEANKWLAANPHINIDKMLQSESGSGSGNDHTFTLTFLYSGQEGSAGQ